MLIIIRFENHKTEVQEVQSKQEHERRSQVPEIMIRILNDLLGIQKITLINLIKTEYNQLS